MPTRCTCKPKGPADPFCEVHWAPRQAGYGVVTEHYDLTDAVTVPEVRPVSRAEIKKIQIGGQMNTFGWAIKQMQNGSKVSRAGWDGRGMWLAIQNPDALSKMTLPYIYMKTASNDLVPWLASQTDMLSTDWETVDADASCAL